MDEIQKIFNHHINIIVETSKNFLQSEDILAIYLYGGYGRDEGSWVIGNKNGKNVVKPYNDYDIAFIFKKKVSKDCIFNLERELLSRIDIRWVDISQYTTTGLRLLNTTVKNYDLKYASKCIYGDKRILKNIPHMDSTSITLKDVRILYETRLWTLLGSFPVSGLTKMTSEDEMFFRNQMAKAVLAIVDIILIVNHQYTPSYVERVTRLKSYCDDNHLLDLASWALSEKLRPKSSNMDNTEVKGLYQKVNNLFFSYFYSVLSQYYGANISSPEDIDRYIAFEPLSFVKRKIKSFFLRDNRGELGMYLLILQGYIAYYYLDMNEKYLNRVKKIMKRKFFFESNDIDDIRIKVSQLRLIL